MSPKKNAKWNIHLRIFTFPQDGLDPFLVAKCCAKHALAAGLNVEIVDRDIMERSVYQEAAALKLSGSKNPNFSSFPYTWLGRNYHVDFSAIITKGKIGINKIYVENVMPAKKQLAFEWLNLKKSEIIDFYEESIMEQEADYRDFLNKPPFFNEPCHKSLHLKATGLSSNDATISLFIPFDFEKTLNWPQQTFGFVQNRGIHRLKVKWVFIFILKGPQQAILEFQEPEHRQETLTLPDVVETGQLLHLSGLEGLQSFQIISISSH